LQQLVINVAGFVVQFFSLADVANQRFDAKAFASCRFAFFRFGSRGQFDPDRVAIGAPQSQEVVVDRSVVVEPLEKRDAGLGIGELRSRSLRSDTRRSA